MALDSLGTLFAWGDGSFGCLGFGESKKRATPTPVPFFEQKNKKVIDVSCGDQFTVVICQVDEQVEPKAGQLPHPLKEFTAVRNPKQEGKVVITT